MTSATLDEALQLRIEEMTAHISLLEAVQKLLDSAKRIAESARLEDYAVLCSELFRLKSCCSSLMIIAASYEESFDSNAIKLLFTNQGGGSQNEY